MFKTEPEIREASSSEQFSPQNTTVEKLSKNQENKKPIRRTIKRGIGRYNIRVSLKVNYDKILTNLYGIEYRSSFIDIFSRSFSYPIEYEMVVLTIDHLLYIYIGEYLFYGLLYFTVGQFIPQCFTDASRYIAGYYFSIQTQVSVGYGSFVDDRLSRLIIQMYRKCDPIQ